MNRQPNSLLNTNLTGVSWPLGTGSTFKVLSRNLSVTISAAFFLLATTVVALQADRLEQTMKSRYGEDGLAYLRAWTNLLLKTDITTTEKLTVVNDFFNRGLTYTDDRLLWKAKDYWATPLQTMGMRGGDCEDYSIAKYFSLLEMGIPANDLRLIYVKATTGGILQAHMVLGYFPNPDAIPLILDNLNPKILPANERADLTPVFSFNSEGLWLGGQKSNTDPTARLSRWRDVLQRMQEEGFNQ
ncbi:transglutaminase-like cysteine peptidase [Gilvimarinus sp. SDUM040013]|uniref:Transglutaminase-like cysteine peptidase n=1 Tax=Gilvimarinus gilvus TaxID=3058038 RepID=A0ABU4RTH7_9GAMM|nr:transglutaminase-like cysteine peptidase [Gilvimarinus sp. SDUM040013]MDO3386916.1 transglutaminase-like cysteine peptidase [Gilvimarinus sp. SDUM040013]MDX6848190.1 transglutaminase-like cysteine peptidase [Gilvimarinus sp. SDUM040013]